MLRRMHIASIKLENTTRILYDHINFSQIFYKILLIEQLDKSWQACWQQVPINKDDEKLSMKEYNENN